MHPIVFTQARRVSRRCRIVLYVARESINISGPYFLFFLADVVLEFPSLFLLLLILEARASGIREYFYEHADAHFLFVCNKFQAILFNSEVRYMDITILKTALRFSQVYLRE